MDMDNLTRLVSALREPMPYYHEAHEAADAIEMLMHERDALRAGLNGLVNCQSRLTRAQMREAAAGLLNGAAWSTDDQSPFVAQNSELRAVLQSAVDLYGREGGPWNILSAPGDWITRARDILSKHYGEHNDRH